LLIKKDGTKWEASFFRDESKCMGVLDSGEGWMNEEGCMRGGAGRVPRPQGEGERSLESSDFSSLGRRQRAFESSNLSFVSCYLSRNMLTTKDNELTSKEVADIIWNQF
jgi:hypothetical protein